MENLLEVMLTQCEKQAEKLTKIKVDDKFMAELDIFDSYFEQLKQVLDKENAAKNNERISNIKLFMELFKIKLENAKEATMNEIKSTGMKKQSIGYGSAKASEAIKFDIRS